MRKLQPSLAEVTVNCTTRGQLSSSAACSVSKRGLVLVLLRFVYYVCVNCFMLLCLKQCVFSNEMLDCLSSVIIRL